MDNDHKLIICGIVCAVCVVLILSCMCITVTDRGDPSIGDFAVDSEGRVYIYFDMKQAVHVYKDGQFLYDYGEMNDMALQPKRGIRFIIAKDEFWMLEGNAFYAMDLEGKLIRTSSYSEAYEEYSAIESHGGTYTDAHGNEYKMEGWFLGRTRVVRNGTDVVFQISELAFFAKLGTLVGILAAILPATTFVRIYLRERREWGY